MIKHISFSTILVSLSLICITTIKAEPWIDTSDIYLKANIQLLADAGFITTPTTTYPLMWHDINRDIKSLHAAALTKQQQNAFYYIKHQFKLAKRNQVRIKGQVGVENTRFTSFGDSFRETNSLQIQTSTMIGNIASNVSFSYYPDAENKSDKKRWDNSYLAAFLGNWVVSVGKQDRWFGPTWDTSLSLTNNARPITALTLTRKSAEPITVPFTEHQVPWTVTTFMGKMDDTRVVKDTLLWGFRFNFKPLKNLEFGITRLAQWGGEGRPQDLKTFWNVLIGKDNCGAGGLDCSGNNEPGNQQAGWDMRYSFNLFDTQMGLYGQYFAEDGANEGGLKMVTKAEVQGGFDMHIDIFSNPSTVFLEITDSYGDCNTGAGIGNCYYEHHIYKTGMRFEGRTLGSLYDNDAKSIVLGAISQLNTNTRLTTKFRYLDLNYDNNDKAPDDPIIGNPLTSIAEEMLMLSSSVQHNYKNWRFTLGADISQSTFKDDLDKETDINASFTVEYNL